MRRINPEYIAVATRTANQCPYFRLLSMRLCEFDIGTSLLEINLEEKHLQPFGFVHGGVFSTIIDAATFWAVFPEIDEDLGMTSVDLKLNYLAPAITGKLIARGRKIKMGKTLGLGAAEVTDEDGKILAHGTSTLIALPHSTLAGSEPLPRKFLDD